MKKPPICLMLLMAVLFSCKKDLTKQVASNDAKLKTQTVPATQIISDFEALGIAVGFFPADTLMNYDIVANPYSSPANPSAKCAKMNTTNVTDDKLTSEPLDGTFTLSSDYHTIKLKIASPTTITNAAFTMDIMNKDIPSQPVLTRHITIGVVANTWTNLSFDFPYTNSNVYNKIVIHFYDPNGDVGTTSTTWYFDDIETPGITYPDMLFNRITIGSQIDQEKSLFLPRSTDANSWYSDHIAAADILSPTETKDGKWHMFLRGSHGGHSTIGIFMAPATFDPTLVGINDWHESLVAGHLNPIISYSLNTSTSGHHYESLTVANPVAVVDEFKTVYLYYMAKDDNENKSYCLATSTDTAGVIFTKSSSNPLVEGPVGLTSHYGTTTSVVYKAGITNPWFHFSHGGDNGSYASNDGSHSQIWVTTENNSTTITNPSTVAVDTSSVDSAYDHKSIEAGRIFRLSNDAHYYMLYSASSTHGDYPDRFNIAISTDLIHWAKLVNTTTPIVFKRGRVGHWDQGGIWSCDVIEKDGYLYMYYEGWGHVGSMVNRSMPYSGPGGHSQVGVAKISRTAFDAWVNSCATTN